MNFAVGSLVKARNREWVVLPESENDLLVLRPLGGTEDEIIGIYLPLETVVPAQFELPDPNQTGDYRSCRLLRDAVRLGTRSCVGPFRSFARIAVNPRPYQLVPLLMALKLDPVRLLIADDVGIGKTIEACLVARELLDRGEVKRLAVLCPPHLAEQWQAELKQKFHINAELVLPGTASRLEKNCSSVESIFDVYQHVIVSMDFIKSDRRRDDFVRACPELVIVDEAHTCAYGFETHGGRHQRHQVLCRLANKADQHLILVTATPHSGKEEAFRSLLKFLNPDFTELPQDLTGPANERHRRNLAAHFVQRRRADIKHFMQTNTPFPNREEAEDTYPLSTDYRRFIENIVKYTQELVSDPGNNHYRQRIRWWSALALLRAIASSPAAAVETLHNRSQVDTAEDVAQADEIGRQTVLDIVSSEHTEGVDSAPGANLGGESEADQKNHRQLKELARQAEKLKGEKDNKIIKAIALAKNFLADGYSPILFCRFIQTAEYVAQQLRESLPNNIQVAAITGLLPPSERELRILELAKAPQKVLVCTDCLSEGINLQEHFDAVIHYDLSWNPTRHEQREGRVDRFGQRRTTVRVLTYYGIDNPIDGIILDVLIKKHKKIRSSLGISVNVPVDTDSVIEAIFEGLLLRERTPATSHQPLLPGLEEYFKPKKEDLHAKWDNAADKEKRSRTMFAQESIKVEEVARELEEATTAIGSVQDVVWFTQQALKAHKAVISEKNGYWQFDLKETPRSLKDIMGNPESFNAQFCYPPGKEMIYLNRTHPIVEGLTSYIMDTALDPQTEGAAKRTGLIRTQAVTRRTTLLILRFRYDIITRRESETLTQLAEECQMLAFEGAPANAQWLDKPHTEILLQATPAGNVLPEQASAFTKKVIEGVDFLRHRIVQEAENRAQYLADAHQRVRTAARMKGISYQVTPQLPADILGIFVYLPFSQDERL
ncbi:MAG: DEAD/DEAH box helicase [Candidatus Schekmanbacteria bacterium]|nr:DEAD/DEAH box helicase [Candidatus Schekmanbacteria bacterium]